MPATVHKYISSNTSEPINPMRLLQPAQIPVLHSKGRIEARRWPIDNTKGGEHLNQVTLGNLTIEDQSIGVASISSLKCLRLTGTLLDSSDEKITYGSTQIPSSSSIVDTGTTLAYLTVDAYDA
ncbi:hypothetical protein FISHEDRAFT_57267 [Fistulina hepatica ATCC 64428]|uniref:Uncharacterized protein n=1 Tax=Fistulina hepatica ATCC 64428 TaxID=1128425 RepID=A0A0D7AJB4_9AGAR|nr:hypothetical protein FISHEDRAFT_57267 [Fistulina hepatica ATCC 64428]